MALSPYNFHLEYLFPQGKLEKGKQRCNSYFPVFKTLMHQTVCPPYCHKFTVPSYVQYISFMRKLIIVEIIDCCGSNKNSISQRKPNFTTIHTLKELLKIKVCLLRAEPSHWAGNSIQSFLSRRFVLYKINITQRYPFT